MKAGLLILLALGLSACGPSAPYVAGELTERDICQLSGYLIRQKLGNKIKTTGIECTATNSGGNAVQISAGYKTPLNSTRYYTATGRVTGDQLRLQTIKDAEGEMPFSEWP